MFAEKAANSIIPYDGILGLAPSKSALVPLLKAHGLLSEAILTLHFKFSQS